MKRWLSIASVLVWAPACSLLTDTDLGRLDGDSGGAGACADVTSCDDGIACTNDFCSAAVGMCVHEANPDECNRGQQCHPTLGCLGGEACASDEECVDETGCAAGRCAGHRCRWEPIDPADPACAG